MKDAADGILPKAIEFADVQRHALLDHFRQSLDLSCVYAVPKDDLLFAPLGGGIREPRPKRRRIETVRSSAGFVCDVDVQDEDLF